MKHPARGRELGLRQTHHAAPVLALMHLPQLFQGLLTSSVTTHPSRPNSKRIHRTDEVLPSASLR